MLKERSSSPRRPLTWASLRTALATALLVLGAPGSAHARHGALRGGR